MTDTNTAANPATPQDRVNAIVQAALDAILDTVTHPEVVALQANPSGIWTKLQSDLRVFAGNLVSVANQPAGEPQPANFHEQLGRPRAADVIDLGVLRTLKLSPTEH